MAQSVGTPIPRVLFLAMTAQFAVAGAFMPFVRPFLTDRGLTAQETSWVFAAAAVGTSTLPLLWGFLADRFIAPARLLAGMNLLVAVIFVVLGRAQGAVSFALLLPLLTGVLFSTFAVLSALSYHVLESPREHFGRLRLWGSLGWGLPAGFVWAWLTVRESSSFGFLPLFGATLALFAAAASWWLPGVPVRGAPLGSPPVDPGVALGAPAPERAAGATSVPARSEGSYLRAVGELLRNRAFLALLTVGFVSFPSFTIWFYYSPSYLEQLGFARRWIGPVQCVGVFAEIPLLLLLGPAIRRLGFRGTLLLGASALLARQLIYATCADPWVLVASYLLAATGIVFSTLALSLALDALTHRTVRATAQTLATFVGPGLGQILGHLVVGWLNRGPTEDLRRGFWFASLCSGLAVVILLVFLRERDFAPRRSGRRPSGEPGPRSVA